MQTRTIARAPPQKIQKPVTAASIHYQRTPLALPQKIQNLLSAPPIHPRLIPPSLPPQKLQNPLLAPTGSHPVPVALQKRVQYLLLAPRIVSHSIPQAFPFRNPVSAPQIHSPH